MTATVMECDRTFKWFLMALTVNSDINVYDRIVYATRCSKRVQDGFPRFQCLSSMFFCVYCISRHRICTSAVVHFHLYFTCITCSIVFCVCVCAPNWLSCVHISLFYHNKKTVKNIKYFYFHIFRQVRHAAHARRKTIKPTPTRHVRSFWLPNQIARSRTRLAPRFD